MLDTLLWSLIKLGENYKRLSHTATQVGSYLFIFGGHDGSSYMADLLLFNLGEHSSSFAHFSVYADNRTGHAHITCNVLSSIITVRTALDRRPATVRTRVPRRMPRRQPCLHLRGVQRS